MSRHLMARFRHLHAADEHGLDFDWKPQETRSGGTYKTYFAPLENGDSIEASGYRPRKNSPEKWAYHIFGPRVSRDEVWDEENQKMKPGPWHHWGDGSATSSPWLGSGGQGDIKAAEEANPKQRTEYTDLRQPTTFDNQHDAMRAAEHHYRALNRKGITPSHTEDYDINQIMREQGF